MTEKNVKWLFFSLLLLWIITMLLTACSTEKKAQRKEAWLIAHGQLDDICARVFPNHDSTIVKDSISFDTLYKESPEVILHDTVYQIGDTIVKIITKKCPPQPVITKTVHDSIFIYRTNTAEVERLKGEVLAKEAQIKAKDDIVIKQQIKIDKNDWWKTACLVTWFVMLLGIITRLFIYKRPI